MSFLDKKIDKGFFEAVGKAPYLTEAIAEWVGSPKEEVEAQLNRIVSSLAEAVKDMDRAEAELTVLKMINPEATLRDYLLLRSLVSLSIANATTGVLKDNVPEHVAGRGLSALLTPSEDEVLVIVGTPNGKGGLNITAMKADPETIFGALNAMAVAHEVINGGEPAELTVTVGAEEDNDGGGEMNE